MNKSTDSKRGFSFNTERSGNREDLSFNPQALAEGTLVSKVALLSCVSAIFMAIGSYFGIGLENSPILVISCIVASFIGLFFLRALHSAPLAVLGLAVWNSLFGVTVGVGLQSYIATLGSHTVSACILASAGAMAVIGAFGALSGIDFRPLQKFCMIALLGLIVFGIVQIFVHMSTGINIAYAAIGLVVFTGFFLVDFCRLAKSGDNSWPEAVDITVNIVLDYVNFTFYLLRLVRELKK